MPSYFAGFGLSQRDSDGYITSLTGATIKVCLVGGADITTLTSNEFGYVNGGQINVPVGTEIEFYHQIYDGTFRQITANSLANSFSLTANFIVSDAAVDFEDPTTGEIWLEDLSAPSLPRQFVANIEPGEGLTFPFTSPTAKNVKLYLISKSATDQPSDTAFATAENATVAVPAYSPAQNFGSINGLASQRLLGRWQAGMGSAQEISIDTSILTLSNGGVLGLKYRGKTVNFSDLIAQTGSFFNAVERLSNPLYFPDAAYTLEITESISVDTLNNSTAVIPVKFHTVFSNEGVFNISGGNRKLRIDNMAQIGMRKIFNATGNASVIFGVGAVEYYNLAWWAGIVSGATVTNAIRDILISCANNSGGRVFVPSGVWLTAGGHDLVSGVTFFGASTNVLDNVGSCLKITTNTYIFKVGENQRNINLIDLVLDGTGTTAKLLWANGTYPNSTYGVHTHNVYFRGGAYGYYIQSNNHASGNPWEFIQGNVTNCYFIGQTVACRYQNTNNNGITGKNNYYSLAANVIGIDAVFAGTLTEENYLVTGTGSTPPAGTYFIRTTGVFQILRLLRGQDENIVGLYKNNGNSYAQVALVLRDNLIQSFLDFNANATVYSYTNIYVNFNVGNFRNGNGWVGGVVNSSPVCVTIWSYGDTVDNRVNPSNFNLNGFTNPNGTQYSFVAHQQTPGRMHTTTRGYHHFDFADGADIFGGGLDRPVGRFAGRLDNKAYLGVGNTDASDNFFGYLIRRQNDSKLHFKCTQAPTFGGYVFDDGIVEMQRYSLPFAKAATMGNVTINKPTGIVTLATGQSTLIVYNNLVNVNTAAIVLQKITNEGNQTYVVGYNKFTAGNAGFQIFLNKTVEDDTEIYFEVKN